ncbi:MAG: hypothetical protein LBD68_01135, partial [Zoogloeaceae bacterium]|nr:hypothetical protein [Zoogloeaceae bacterium]
RKFQLIQATYISHMFREAFLRGNLSRAEKRAARLAFGYAGSRRHLPEFRGGLLGFVGDPRGA